MRNFSLLVCLFISSFLIAQEGPFEPCGLYGEGTNGTTTDCDVGPITYFSSCCSGDIGWFWTIEGTIDIYSSTSLPLYLPGGEGKVISASSNRIVIDWYCPAVCPSNGYTIVELTSCGNEWFDSMIRVACSQPCPPTIQQCYLLDCGACLGIYVNNQPVILEHNSNEPKLWCFDFGTVGCSTFSCNTGVASMDAAIFIANKPVESIPKIEIIALEDLIKLGIQPNLISSNTQIEVAIPPSNTKTQFQLNDINGNTIIDQLVYEGTNRIELGDLSSGMYVAAIHNNDFTYTKKIIIQN